MMHQSIYFIFVVVLILQKCIALPESVIESWDIDVVLKNERIVEYYGKCFSGIGPCTTQAKDLMKAARPIILNGCATCTEREKEVVKKAALFAKKYKPRYYDLILSKHDPSGKLRGPFEAFLSRT